MMEMMASPISVGGGAGWELHGTANVTDPFVEQLPRGGIPKAIHAPEENSRDPYGISWTLVSVDVCVWSFTQAPPCLGSGASSALSAFHAHTVPGTLHWIGNV